MFYNARWLDVYLNQFTQPDTIVPDLYNPQSLNRYSYVLNNPIRYNDPTGHREACDDGDTCKVQRKYSKLNAVDTWKKIIKDKFDITMSEDSDPHNPNPKAWDVKNLATITASLNKMDAALNGKLKSLAGGATFKWGEYNNDACGGGGTYCGRTYGTTIEFFTVGQASIRVPNIFHEFGHVLDNSPGMVDVFSHDPGINNPDFLTDDGYLDRLASKITEATEDTGFYKELDYLFNTAKYTIDRSGQYLIRPH